MENIVSLEIAAKSIFLQCIKDPEILEILKNQINLGKNYTNDDIREKSSTVEKGDNSAIIQMIESLKKSQEEKFDKTWNMINDLKENDKMSPIIFSKLRKESPEDSTILKENKELKEQLQELHRKNKDFESENKELKNGLFRTQERYKDFQEIVEVWENLKTISEESKDYIKELCGDFDLYSCFSLGRDEGKINQLWNYLKEQAIKVDSNYMDIEKINRYFELCLQVANSVSSGRNQFVSFELPINSDYDMDRCIKTFNSKQIGVVKKTIIKGFKRDERIVYKSIVKIE